LMSLKWDSHDLLQLIHMQQATSQRLPTEAVRDGGRNSKEKEGSLSGTTPSDAHGFAAHKRLWSDKFNNEGQRQLPLPRPHGRTCRLDV
jgi:hypothetical protein